MPRVTRKSKKAQDNDVDNDVDDFASSGDAPNNPNFVDGKNDRRAIESASQARDLARKLDTDDLRGRDPRRAMILGAFNGNAPYSPSDLKSQGLDWHFNVSFNHMAGVIGRATVPYTRFGLDVRYLTRFMGDMEPWRMDRLRAEYVRAVKRWGRWSKFYTRLVQELNLMGWAAGVWLDEYTPWPEFSPQNRTFVPDESPNDVEDLDVIVIKKHYLVHQLYEKIEDAKSAKKAGWVVKNVQGALMNAMPKRLADTRNWEETQKAIRGGYIYWAYSSAKVVTVYHVLVQEITGKVSHWGVEWREGDSVTPENPKTSTADRGLFKVLDQFDSMKQVATYFDAEPGDSCWHGPRGAGQRAYNTHVQRDKLLNQILTSTMLSLLLPVKVPDDIRGNQLDLFVALPFCQIPPGVELLADKIPGVTQDVFATDALLTATAEQNQGDVIPSGRAPTTIDTKKTATQANIDAGRQNEIRQSGIERFVDPFAKLHGEIFRRLCKKGSQNADAKEFQKRLRDVGVLEKNESPADLVKKIEIASFYEIKDVTGESAVASQAIFTEMRGDLTVEQRPLYEDRIRNLMGPEAVLRYMPEEANKIDFTEAVRQQQIEITAMLLGEVIEVLPEDKHEAHATGAIQWLQNAFMTAAQGGEGHPVEVIAAIITHAEQHLAALAQDERHKMLVPKLQAQLAPMKQLFQQLNAAAQAALGGNGSNGGSMPTPSGPNNAAKPAGLAPQDRVNANVAGF